MGTPIAASDNNRCIRNRIIVLLNTDPAFNPVASSSHARQCVDCVMSDCPGSVTMAKEQPGATGIQALNQLISEALPIQIQPVVDKDIWVFDFISDEASGDILPIQSTTSLTDPFRETQADAITRKLLNLLEQANREKRRASADYKLTRREKEVVLAIVKGLSYKMIAYDLKISYETVRSHIKNIYKKLHVASLTELVAKAINLHIV